MIRIVRIILAGTGQWRQPMPLLITLVEFADNFKHDPAGGEETAAMHPPSVHARNLTEHGKLFTLDDNAPSIRKRSRP